MSECARVIHWADRSDTFDLAHPWVRNVLAYRGLPGQFGDTPVACLKRFEEGVYSTDDVERVIELGLIGGGKSRADAHALVEQHVRRSPIGSSAIVAFDVIAALFIGAVPDAVAST